MEEIQLIKNKFFWCLKETHASDCICSYCGNDFRKPTINYGLNIPKDWKSFNSWYVIKYGRGKYIRWTNSWINLLKKKYKSS